MQICTFSLYLVELDFRYVCFSAFFLDVSFDSILEMAYSNPNFCDSVTPIDEFSTNSTEPSNGLQPCQLIQSHKLNVGSVHAKRLPSELSPDLASLDEHQLLKEAYTRLKGGKLPDSHLSFSVIPKFYSKPPAEESYLALKLREEARSRFLKERSSQLPDNQEVRMW